VSKHSTCDDTILKLKDTITHLQNEIVDLKQEVSSALNEHIRENSEIETTVSAKLMEIQRLQHENKTILQENDILSLRIEEFEHQVREIPILQTELEDLRHEQAEQHRKNEEL